ncbi:putative pyruvate dehydrogenase complex component Pdx1 [Aspergillus chevalieri]|uniref:Pyridoxine biosynthesis protein n=1 Tax=Aspergillus chevalieri TaxID=182096 RepID=A0A7R7VV07_ASPCH|nr:pyridoxine biosynthesis protein [Aspergillus chevalieri]BCR91261.1 pyridoxine biosynthesis protein [Aspergillus chevalieri]
MASNFPARQIPAMFARRQQPTRVHSAARRFASTTVQTQNPAYPLYPSVTQLLHEKGIPDSEISKIPASGPKGRLLKGDVLAYLGSIPADYPSTQAARIDKLAHLDLSNIKIAAPPAPKPEPVPEKMEAPAPPPTTSVALSISLSAVLSVQRKIKESLGITVPLSEFLARATDLANEELPRSAAQKPSADELFDEILGGEPVTTSRGDYIPELNEVDAPVARAQPVQEDLIDFLAGKVSKKSSSSRVVSPVEEPAANVFSLTVPVSEEKRAKAFLDRVETLLTVEPGRLVI